MSTIVAIREADGTAFIGSDSRSIDGWGETMPTTAVKWFEIDVAKGWLWVGLVGNSAGRLIANKITLDRGDPQEFVDKFREQLGEHWNPTQKSRDDGGSPIYATGGIILTRHGLYDLATDGMVTRIEPVVGLDAAFWARGNGRSWAGGYVMACLQARHPDATVRPAGEPGEFIRSAIECASTFDTGTGGPPQAVQINRAGVVVA